MTLRGKVAIVTGSGGEGTGRATARRFAREGADVVVSDINYRGGQQTVELIRSEGGSAVFCLADVRSETDVRTLAGFAESSFGGLDILVNNASNPDGMGLLTGWAEAVALEIMGPMNAALAAIEAMRRRGGGAIVNIGSTSALGHGKQHSPWPAYDVGKMAQMRLTTTLGRLRASDNIRVKLPGAGVDRVARAQGVLGEPHSGAAARARRAGYAAIARRGGRGHFAPGNRRIAVRPHHGLAERPTAAPDCRRR